MLTRLLKSHLRPYKKVLLLIVVLLLVWHHRLSRHARRFQTITGRGYRPRIIDLGRSRPQGPQSPGSTVVETEPGRGFGEQLLLLAQQQVQIKSLSFASQCHELARV